MGTHNSDVTVTIPVTGSIDELCSLPDEDKFKLFKNEIYRLTEDYRWQFHEITRYYRPYGDKNLETNMRKALYIASLFHPKQE